MVTILIVLAVIGLTVAALLVGNRFYAQPVHQSPLSSEEFTLRAKGWSNEELDKILSDFGKNYGYPADSFQSVEIGDGVLAVQPSAPITVDQLLFLVNYLHYPNGFDLKDRHLSVAAEIVVSDKLGLPPEANGLRAVIYVPSGDTEFDEVFAKVGPNSHFRISFTDLHWVPVAEAREPKGIARLME